MSFETDPIDLEETPSDLLRSVKIHDEQAWMRLLQIYSPIVHLWCHKAGLQEADAADAAQEVFKGIAGSFELFERKGAGSFRAWLKVVTRNKIADFYRRNARQPQAAGGHSSQTSLDLYPGPEVLPDKVPSEARESQIILQALELLRAEIKDHTWEIFWRTTVDGHDARQVAEELNMKLGAVYQAKSRTLIRLRQLLSELEPPAQLCDGEFTDN